MTISYCSECDALLDECDHNAHRYLDPIEYEKAETGGWKVPEHEQTRWDLAPLRLAQAGVRPRRREAKPVATLIVEVENAIYLQQDIEDQLRAAYELRPEKVTRLVEHTLTGVKDGTLKNPSGFLAKRLRELSPTFERQQGAPR